MTTQEAVTTRRGFFAVWSYTDYRKLWISGMGTYIGRWIETVVGSWLVLQLTGSPALVGLLGACRFAAMLLGPLCGTISDRYERKRILLIVQTAYGVAALSMAALFLTGYLATWHIFVFTIIAGAGFTMDYSARYAAAADIVKREHLVNAVSFMYMAMGSTSVFGPLIGGSLLEIIGPTNMFAFIAICFLFSFLMLVTIKIPKLDKPPYTGSMWKNIIDGVSYIRKDRIKLALILIAALVNLFVFPYWYTLIPLFAHDILYTTASGYGQLMAATGFGTATGSMIVATLPTEYNKGKLFVFSVIAWPLFLVVFATSKVFALSAFLLILAGCSQGIAMALIQYMLLSTSSEDMRGRVVGVRAFAVGTMPLGNLMAGIGAGLWGLPAMQYINSTASILITFIIVYWAKEILRQK